MDWELMTATDPFYLSVPGDPFPMFRSRSWAIPTEPWTPGDLLEESPVFDCSAHSGILLILCP